MTACRPVTDTTTTVVSTSVNDAPVAMDDSDLTDEDTVLNVAAPAGVLGNDSDLDGGALVVSAVEGNPAAVGNALPWARGRCSRSTPMAPSATTPTGPSSTWARARATWTPSPTR